MFSGRYFPKGYFPGRYFPNAAEAAEGQFSFFGSGSIVVSGEAPSAFDPATVTFEFSGSGTIALEGAAGSAFEAGGPLDVGYSGGGTVEVSGAALASGPRAESVGGGAPRRRPRRPRLPAFQPFLPDWPAASYVFVASGAISVVGRAETSASASFPAEGRGQIPRAAGVASSSFRSPIREQRAREEDELLLLTA